MYKQYKVTKYYKLGGVSVSSVAIFFFLYRDWKNKKIFFKHVTSGMFIVLLDQSHISSSLQGHNSFIEEEKPFLFLVSKHSPAALSL